MEALLESPVEFFQPGIKRKQEEESNKSAKAQKRQINDSPFISLTDKHGHSQPADQLQICMYCKL